MQRSGEIMGRGDGWRGVGEPLSLEAKEPVLSVAQVLRSGVPWFKLGAAAVRGVQPEEAHQKTH